MAIIFDRINKIIEVEAPVDVVTVQELVNAIRNWEDDQVNLDMPHVAQAAGKSALGSGISVGITLELLDNWQVMFENRNGPDWIQCIIKDGNLVGGINGNPIKSSAYVQVKLIQSAAGTITVTGSGVTEQDKIDIADTVLDLENSIESDINLRSAIRVLLATLAGRASGGGTPEITFKNPDGTLSRLSITVDENGNRSLVTIYS